MPAKKDAPRPTWVMLVVGGAFAGFWLSASVGYIQAGLNQRRLGLEIDDFSGAIGDTYENPHVAVPTGWVKRWQGKVVMGAIMLVLPVIGIIRVLSA